MKKTTLLSYAFAALLLTGMTTGLTACSDDDDEVTTDTSSSSSDDDDSSSDDTTDDDSSSTEEETTEAYVWTTDNGLNAVDHLLFDESGNEDPSGTVIGNGESELVFTGTQTLAQGTYTLMGWIYVADGATLTIEAGTVIKGDKTTQAALIVEPGGKLYAQGTADEPIVFTSAQEKGSRKPGDWGGLIVCGNAYNNQGTMQIEGGPRTTHGGSDDSDNSGVLSYVRVEFAGYPFQTDKEINGITFGSVGSGTQIDHLQVSYSNDDSFEWFGGCADAKYLVAFHGWDDDFDTDNGFSGNVQYGLVVRNPRIADTSQSNGFESDNCSDGSAVEPYTSCTFSNITFIGPKCYDGFENTTDYITGGDFYPNNGSALGKFQSAMQIRRGSHLACFNSIAVGYPIGVIIDGEKGGTVEYAEAGNLMLQNIFFADMDAVGTDANKKYDDYLLLDSGEYDETQVSFSHSYFVAQSGNVVYDSADELLLTDGRSIGAAYMPQSGSPVFGAQDWSNSLLSAFDQVDYIGAFGDDDSWLDGWTNFDPNNTDY